MLLELLKEGERGDGKARVPRGIAWSDWEDRALAIQILADDPIADKTGTKQEIWTKVAEHLKAVGINRTWISCKDRIDRLVTLHRQNEKLSRQKTGEVEEVNEFMENLNEISLLFKTVSSDRKIQRDAKGKAAVKKEKGSIVRVASSRGMVRKVLLPKENASDRDKEMGKPTKAPKNVLTKQLDTIVSGLQQKAEEFRKEAIEVRKREEIRKDMEKRDMESREEQKNLNESLKLLIQAQNSTNNMMKKWIDQSK